MITMNLLFSVKSMFMPYSVIVSRLKMQIPLNSKDAIDLSKSQMEKIEILLFALCVLVTENWYGIKNII